MSGLGERFEGPWQEIRVTGEIGTLTVDLIYGTVAAVARFDRYPPPEGHDRWDADAVEAVAHDFIVDDPTAEKVSSGRLSRLVATATDERSFERVVETSVRNHFRAMARRTDKGAALRSLRRAANRDDDVVVVGATATTETWSLAGFAHEAPYSGRVAPLIEAAYAVNDVRQARWSPTSKRRPPIAEPDSLRRVIHEILNTAAAPVAPRLMLEVIIARFPLVVSRPSTELDDAIAAPVAVSPEAGLLAAEIWEQLTDNERLVVAVLADKVRNVAAVTGLTKSTADRACRSARLVLKVCLDGLDDKDPVVAALRELSLRTQQRGTNLGGLASITSKEV